MPQLHRTWVEPVMKTFKGTSYRAKCDCDWVWIEVPMTFQEAKRMAKLHEEIMKDPNKYRSNKDG